MTLDKVTAKASLARMMFIGALMEVATANKRYAIKRAGEFDTNRE